MTKSNDAKSLQIGMPFGTACGKLRKLILFNLLVKSGKNICFKCSLQIETPRELSIEHKRPWFNVDPELFWDLDNIAFSHLSCNRPDPEPGTVKRIIPPDGMSWCTGHREFHPIADFRLMGTANKNPRWGWNGVEKLCRRYNTERELKRRGYR